LIRCFRPRFTGNELDRLKKCLDSGTLACGPLVAEFEEKWKSMSRKKFNIGFNSGSAASLAIFTFLSTKYGPCDVYAPSLSFSSPIWAARDCGHNIFFVDIFLQNFSTSGELIEKAIASSSSRPRKKKVIFPLLYGGIPRIDVGKSTDDAVLVVDACHTPTPSISSDYIFFSFHPVKPIGMGNGGMVSTDDEEAAQFFLKFRDFGRMHLDASYDVVQTGFNCYMNDLNAAIGLAQLDSYDENLRRRRSIAEFYDQHIDRERYQIPSHTDSSGKASYYLYTVVARNGKNVNGLIRHMESRGIEVSIHYPLIHKLSYFRTEPQVRLDTSEAVEGRFINIPCHSSMSVEDAKEVADSLNSYRLR
jgi:perosamine synthetase